MEYEIFMIEYILYSQMVRITFTFLLITYIVSDSEISPDNKYHLHKYNNNLKLTRVIFHFNNNIDIKLFQEEEFVIEFIKIFPLDEKNFANIPASKDPNAIINFPALKSISGDNLSMKDIIDYKMNLMEFQTEKLKESLISVEKSNEQVSLNKIAVQIQDYLYLIFETDFVLDAPAEPKTLKVRVIILSTLSENQRFVVVLLRIERKILKR